MEWPEQGGGRGVFGASGAGGGVQGACGNGVLGTLALSLQCPSQGPERPLELAPLGSNKLLCWKHFMKSAWGKPSEPVIGHQANQFHGFAVTTGDFLSRAPTVSSAN